MRKKLFEEKIQNKTLQIGVIGLGYVGLPLACEFAKTGINVTGFDINKKKTQQVNQGISYINDV